MPTRRQILLTLLASILLAVGFTALLSRWNAAPCTWNERVKTTHDAIEFGKYWLRRDELAWRRLGISSLDELNAELRKQDCCSAGPIDPDENDGREWRVGIYLERAPNGLDYGLAFPACRTVVDMEVMLVDR